MSKVPMMLQIRPMGVQENLLFETFNKFGDDWAIGTFEDETSTINGIDPVIGKHSSNIQTSSIF